MSKRRQSKDDPEKIKPKKPYIDQEQTGQHDDEAMLPDSGYSDSQQSQPMEVDISSPAADSHSNDSAVHDQSEEDNFPRELLSTKVDEDSNQMITDITSNVGTIDRPFAENVLHCTIAIGPEAASQQKKEEKQREKQGLDAMDKETFKDSVLNRSDALLNSGGGLLKIRIADFQKLKSKHDALDDFWKKVEPKLKEMIKPSSYDDVFDRRESGDEILLFVNAPPHLCTMDYNLYVPGDAGKGEASYEKTVELLKNTPKNKKQRLSNVVVSLKELPEVPEVFRKEENLNLNESKQVQFKHYTSATLFNNHKQCDVLAEQTSAFANASGGNIFLGVKNNGQVCGLDRTQTENIEGKVSSIINQMYWNFVPERKVHWDLQSIPVLGSESVVIVISVAGSFGGVFAKCPKCFELHQSTDGQQIIHQLKFEEWKERMLCREGLQSDRKALQAMISRFQELRISKGYLMTVKGDVQRIRDAFFVVNEEFPVFPAGFESKLPEEAQTVIQQLQKQCTRDRNRGLLVASRSWLGNTGGTRKQGQAGIICDLLLISRNMGGLHLYTLCHGDTDDRFLQYSQETAKSIKASLVRDGACRSKFYVSYHVISCTNPTEIEPPSSDVRYPKEYGLESTREKLNDLLKAMVFILASVQSPLSSKLGVSIMNLLTKEQFQLLHQQIEVNRELWIKGVAGTGKTLVAVEFMKQLLHREKLDKKEILCVCENEGIANQIREHDVCTVICRQTFLKVRSEYPKVKHVVMDEVHNFEQPGSVSWFEKARKLVRQHDPDRPGYFWLFTDKCQKTHDFPSGIPDEQKPQFRLKKVIRNSQRIFNHSQQYVTEDNVRDTLELGHDFKGEGVDTITYSVSKTTQLNVLNETYNKLLQSGFREGDIAILFKKKDSIPDLPFEYKTAVNNSSDSLVVSSVLMYSGLERPVVVLVDVTDRIPWKRKPGPFNYSAVTRAMVKLVIIQCEN